MRVSDRLVARTALATPSAQDVVGSLKVGRATAQGRLVRLPLSMPRADPAIRQYQLAFRLENLISMKGDDVLLTTPSSQMVRVTDFVPRFPPSYGDGPSLLVGNGPWDKSTSTPLSCVLSSPAFDGGLNTNFIYQYPFVTLHRFPGMLALSYQRAEQFPQTSAYLV